MTAPGDAVWDQLPTWVRTHAVETGHLIGPNLECVCGLLCDAGDQLARHLKTLALAAIAGGRTSDAGLLILTIGPTWNGTVAALEQTVSDLLAGDL